MQTDQQENNYSAGYFRLQATRFPAGTPITAIRSKKAYSNLVDEREFLLNLRAQWVQKLEDLKEDQKYLHKMKRIKKEEIVDIEPLFAREEKKLSDSQEQGQLQGQANVQVYPQEQAILEEKVQPQEQAVEHSQPAHLLTEEHISPPIKEFDAEAVINHPSPSEVEAITTFAELEAIFKSKYPELDLDEEEEEEDEEDEEKARTALNLMLQEFGESI